MSMDFEIEDDREPLRDTPEGELWTSVLVDAVEDLEDSLKWLRSVYDERRAQIDLDLESGRIAPPRYRERLRELEREHKARQEQVDSCTWFFFGSGLNASGNARRREPSGPPEGPDLLERQLS